MDERPLGHQLPILAEALRRRDIVTIGHADPPRMERIGRISRLPTIFADPLARYHEAALAGHGHAPHLIELKA